MLLTTREVAALLKVHPKHVYRLLKRGLPAHRVGDEWRFDEAEVRAYCRGRSEPEDAAAAPGVSVVAPSAPAPPLLAANGDVAIEALLAGARLGSGARLGLLSTDHAGAAALLRSRAVLVAGCHGDACPPELGDLALARMHLVEREVGLVFRRGRPVRSVSSLVGRAFASRASSAGVRAHLDDALAKAGVEPARALERATDFASHCEVTLAVCRGAAEIGLATRAWAERAGLGFLPLVSEGYGLVVRAEDVAHPLFVALCDEAQQGALRRRLSSDFGYVTRRTGELRAHAASR